MTVHCDLLLLLNTVHGPERPGMHEHNENSGMEHGTDIVPETTDGDIIAHSNLSLLFNEVHKGPGNFQCRETFPPDPEMQRFREPLGTLPSCSPLPINDREVDRKVRNIKAHSPKLVGVKERAGTWWTNIKLNQMAEEE